MSTRCDALSVLKRDHRHLKSLFHQIDLAARKHDAEAVRDLAGQIVTELNRHVNLEEHLFYPAISEWLPGARGEVLENIEEHRALRFLLDALQTASPTDEEFRPRLRVLREILSHHVDEEENDLFPQVREAVTPADLRALGQELEARHDTAPPPDEAAPFMKVARPERELADRARQRQVPLPTRRV